MFSFPSPIFPLFLAFIVFHYLRTRASRGRYSHPPGPAGYPLVGNLFDIPAMPTWVTYRRWGEKYKSPVLRLNILGQNILVCNTLKVVLDLLDKRSAIYSDRPSLTMSRELCGWDWAFSSMPYGQEWRTRNKVFHTHFHSRVVKQWRPVEVKATHQFLRRVLDVPTGFMQHIRHLAGDQIMQMAYGIQVQQNDDPYLRLAEEAMACGRAVSTTGGYLVDVFPILKYVPAWLPGAGFKRQARVWRKSVQAVLEEPYQDYERRRASGDIPDCIATSLVEELQSYDQNPAPFTEEDAKAVLAVIYAAGSDTTVSTIQSFILAMVLYPEVQRKAQAEIDRVCNGRLPEFDDYDALPYVEAIVREALRWNPVVPEAVPHASTEDDFYQGFFIPKGSIIVPNSWAILHDEQYYPDPHTFSPDRFMKDGNIDPNVLDPGIAAFGYGRRICPGRFMARDSIWITVASMLAVLNIQPAKDANGRPVIPSGEYDHSFICNPKPFLCDIRPRSARHEALIISVSQ